ncbi:mid1-interacting protein 1-like [Limulus polyphemus]|uniref:Mid1-interacting protein 1-like n=1 Tax=Limulus polyphemus TaxID=6850 RepID=A0ABM1TCU4_LIMPO|nr:mid1-interacting protein 1-like [Limulus polyphemus]
MQSYHRKQYLQRSCHGVGSDRFSFSEQSVVSAMDRFVKSIKNMDSTILLPSRLKDMDVGANGVSMEKCSSPIDLLLKIDMSNLYSLLHDVKNELVWGPALVNITDPTPTLNRIVQVRSSAIVETPSHPQENIALGSAGSSTSDSDSVGDSDCMNSLGLTLGLANEQNKGLEGAQIVRLANSFRYHLQGLQTILNQFSDSADYLSSRYQEEVDVCFR